MSLQSSVHPLAGDGIRSQFFQYLSRKAKARGTCNVHGATAEGRHVRVFIPDTVIMARYPTMWVYTDPVNGDIRRKTSRITPDAIVEAFVRNGRHTATDLRSADTAAESDYINDYAGDMYRGPSPHHAAGSDSSFSKLDVVAVFYPQNASRADLPHHLADDNTTAPLKEALFFTAAELASFLSDPPQHYGILQKFVLPRGDFNSALLVAWAPHVTHVTRRVSLGRLYDTHAPKGSRCTTFEGPHAFSREVHVTRSLVARCAAVCSEVNRRFAQSEASQFSISRMVLVLKEHAIYKDAFWLLVTCSVRVCEGKSGNAVYNAPLRLSLFEEASQSGDEGSDSDTPNQTGFAGKQAGLTRAAPSNDTTTTLPRLPPHLRPMQRRPHTSIDKPLVPPLEAPKSPPQNQRGHPIPVHLRSRWDGSAVVETGADTRYSHEVKMATVRLAREKAAALKASEDAAAEKSKLVLLKAGFQQIVNAAEGGPSLASVLRLQDRSGRSQHSGSKKVNSIATLRKECRYYEQRIGAESEALEMLENQLKAGGAHLAPAPRVIAPADAEEEEPIIHAPIRRLSRQSSSQQLMPSSDKYIVPPWPLLCTSDVAYEGSLDVLYQIRTCRVSRNYDSLEADDVAGKNVAIVRMLLSARIGRALSVLISLSGAEGLSVCEIDGPAAAPAGTEGTHTAFYHLFECIGKPSLLRANLDLVMRAISKDPSSLPHVLQSVVRSDLALSTDIELPQTLLEEIRSHHILAG